MNQRDRSKQAIVHNHKLESNGGRRRHEETTVGHTRGEGYEGVMREIGG